MELPTGLRSAADHSEEAAAPAQQTVAEVIQLRTATAYAGASARFDEPRVQPLQLWEPYTRRSHSDRSRRIATARTAFHDLIEQTDETPTA